MADIIHVSDEESESEDDMMETHDDSPGNVTSEEDDNQQNDKINNTTTTTTNNNNNNNNNNINNNNNNNNNNTTTTNIPPQQQDPSAPLQSVKHSRVHPNFLNSNSTSHIWAFGAIAELIDNATDPDVQAKTLKIDVLEANSENPKLMLTDNGKGASPGTLHKMVSFGFSEKVQVGSHLPIGQYGSGFKSGSMRLGKDALVFTRHPEGPSEGTCSVALLSQTFLKEINALEVLVPMVHYNLSQTQMQGDRASGKENLDIIKKFSPVKTDKAIEEHFTALGEQGTRIIIWNLRHEDVEEQQPDGSVKTARYCEFDFSNPKDICIRDFSKEKPNLKERSRKDSGKLASSLRSYVTILYLKPRMHVILRGKKVNHRLIESSLAKTKRDYYNPRKAGTKYQITFGLNALTDTEDDNLNYGMLLYHKGRLIKPFLRVGIQTQNSRAGYGVVGVIDAPFLKPAHNKQDFMDSREYQLCCSGLASRLQLYWADLKKGSQGAEPLTDDEKTQVMPDVTWVMCDRCNKWRRMPDDVSPQEFDDEEWFCEMNEIKEYADCSVPQEPEQQETFGDLVEIRRAVRNKRKPGVKEQDSETQIKKLQANQQIYKRNQKTLSQQVQEKDRELKRKSLELEKYKKQNEELKRKRAQDQGGGGDTRGEKRAKVSESPEPEDVSSVNDLDPVLTKVAKIFRAVAGLPEGTGPEWEDPNFWLQLDVESTAKDLREHRNKEVETLAENMAEDCLSYINVLRQALIKAGKTQQEIEGFTYSDTVSQSSLQREAKIFRNLLGKFSGELKPTFITLKEILDRDVPHFPK